MTNADGRMAERAKWTSEEVGYIYNWCKVTMKTHPHIKFKVSKCLTCLQTDPMAIEIFHALHTLDSARLMTGFKKLHEKDCEHRFDDEYPAVMMWLQSK